MAIGLAEIAAITAAAASQVDLILDRILSSTQTTVESASVLLIDSC